MTLAGLRIGDLVRCDVKGRIFYAMVESKPDAEGVSIAPLDRRVTYRHVTATQIREHWRRAGRK